MDERDWRTSKILYPSPTKLFPGLDTRMPRCIEQIPPKAHRVHIYELIGSNIVGDHVYDHYYDQRT